MFKRLHRLSRGEDIDEVFGKGRFIRGGFVSLKVKKTEFDYARLGVIAGQKISKKATERNRAKRQLREAARPHIKEMKGVDVMLLPTADILGRTFREVKEEVERLFKKIQ